jgi:hypothetical protein
VEEGLTGISARMGENIFTLPYYLHSAIDSLHQGSLPIHLQLQCVHC